MFRNKSINYTERKLFINNMNSWFSNFIIEEFRTDYLPESKLQTNIMGTIDPEGGPLPKLFEPKETTIEVGYNYSQEIFDNDILIFNLDDSSLPEVEFVMRGLQNIKIENEKILIIVSNIMTWAETPLKIFTEEEINQEGFNEEEVPEIVEEVEEKIDINLINNVINNEEKENEEEKDDKKSTETKGSKEDEKKVKEKEDKNKDAKTNKQKIKKKETKSNIKKNKDIKDKDNKKDMKKSKKNKDSKDNKETKDSKESQGDNKNEKDLKIEEEKNITDRQKDQKLEPQNSDEQNQPEQTGQITDVEALKNLSEESIPKKPEKPKIRTFYYKDSEYQKRVPNSRYFYYKILETLALKNKNPNLKTYVVCPGFVYGCGEDFFFDYFRMAWMGHLPYIPIITEGNNFLPTIHILDLVKVIKRIIDRKPEQNYIFACDRTKNPTMKNILKSIGKCIGGLDVKQLKEFDLDNIDIPNYTELKIDIRIKPSNIFDDEERRTKEDLEDYQNRIFPWHCEFGIPENTNIIRDEFNLYRDLKPIKIVITGPPSGGKTTLSQFISNKYKLNYYQINQFCDWAKSLNNELGQETKMHLEEIEENIEKALDDYEHRKNKRKTDPPLDTSQLKKFSSEFMGKILKEKLSKGEFVTKGYILDNYPKTYEDCVNMFCTTSYDKEKTDEYISDKNLIPDSVIIINNFLEESLRDKLQKSEDYAENQFDIDNRFNRRLILYKTQNEYTEENTKLIQDFYKENNIDVYFLDEQKYMLNKEEEEQKVIEFLERKGPIDNYSKLHDEDEVIPYIEKPAENIVIESQPKEENVILDENNSFGAGNKNEIIKEENENNQNNQNNQNNNNSNNKSNIVNISKNNVSKSNNNLSKNNITNDASKKKSKDDKNNTINKQEDIIEKEEEENKSEKKEEKIEEENKINNNEISAVNEQKNEFIKEEKILQDKLKELKEREKKLLEKKSEVIRRYLSENVMPLLSKGILSICETMPDDPVDALANFLLDNSFNLEKESNDKLKINDFEKIMDNV